LRCRVLLSPAAPPPRQLHVVVESDFSGGQRAVLLDPLLVCGPLHAAPVAAELERQAREAEVRDGAEEAASPESWRRDLSPTRPCRAGAQASDWMARDLKVRFVTEGQVRWGCTRYPGAQAGLEPLSLPQAMRNAHVPWLKA
jgi:hypothetical protein